MNDFKIKVKKWTSCGQATQGVNTFIEKCNEQSINILDMTTHVTEREDFMTYVFIFKVDKEIENKKVWNDERW